MQRTTALCLPDDIWIHIFDTASGKSVPMHCVSVVGCSIDTYRNIRLVCSFFRALACRSAWAVLKQCLGRPDSVIEAVHWEDFACSFVPRPRWRSSLGRRTAAGTRGPVWKSVLALHSALISGYVPRPPDGGWRNDCKEAMLPVPTDPLGSSAAVLHVHRSVRSLLSAEFIRFLSYASHFRKSETIVGAERVTLHWRGNRPDSASPARDDAPWTCIQASFVPPRIGRLAPSPQQGGCAAEEAPPPEEVTLQHHMHGGEEGGGGEECARPLPWKECASICRGLLRCLTELHSAGPRCVHGSVSPRRIFVTKLRPTDAEMRVRLADFQYAPPSCENAPDLIRPLRLPPELTWDDDCTRSQPSDIWAFGTVLFEALTGDKLIDVEEENIDFFEPASLHSFVASVRQAFGMQTPLHLLALLSSALDVDPRSRETAPSLLQRACAGNAARVLHPEGVLSAPPERMGVEEQQRKAKRAWKAIRRVGCEWSEVWKYVAVCFLDQHGLGGCVLELAAHAFAAYFAVESARNPTHVYLTASCAASLAAKFAASTTTSAEEVAALSPFVNLAKEEDAVTSEAAILFACDADLLRIDRGLLFWEARAKVEALLEREGLPLHVTKTMLHLHDAVLRVLLLSGWYVTTSLWHGTDDALRVVVANLLFPLTGKRMPFRDARQAAAIGSLVFQQQQEATVVSSCHVTRMNTKVLLAGLYTSPWRKKGARARPFWWKAWDWRAKVSHLELVSAVCTHSSAPPSSHARSRGSSFSTC